MTADLVIHIGSPKSGSSAIQRFCLGNRDALARHGFFYPAHEQDRNQVTSGHTPIATPLQQDQPEKAQQVFDKYLAQARKARQTLLLSSEAFFRHAEQTRKITAGLDVEVLAFVRHPIETLVSSHNQGIKRHFSTRSLVGHCNDMASRANVQFTVPFLTQWADTFGDANCRFLPYLADWYREHSLEEDLLLAIGLPREAISDFAIDRRRVNRSYVPEATELKRLLNSVLTQQDGALNQQVDFILQAYSDAAPENGASSLSTLPPVLLEQLEQAYAGALEVLGERFPTLRGAFSTVADHTLRQDRERPQRLLDLVGRLFAQQPELEQLVHSRLTRQLSEGVHSAPLLKLADLLGFETGGEIELDVLLPETRRKRLLDPSNEPADLLRELALMFETAGDLEAALQFIERAIAVRPKGEQLLRARERLQRKQAQARPGSRP